MESYCWSSTHQLGLHGRPNGTIISQVWPSCWLWGILIMVGCVLSQLKPSELYILSCREDRGLRARFFPQVRMQSSSGFILYDVLTRRLAMKIPPRCNQWLSHAGQFWISCYDLIQTTKNLANIMVQGVHVENFEKKKSYTIWDQVRPSCFVLWALSPSVIGWIRY